MPVFENSDRVGYFKDLVQPVRYVENGLSLSRQAFDEVLQPPGLGQTEGGGRLVHNEQAGVQRDRFGDLDQLLLGDRQISNDCVRVDADFQLFQRFDGLLPHRIPVNQVRGPAALASQKDILGHRKGWNQ